ncbi:DnaD domain protein [Bacillus sp. ISL-7]|uniref:DnaD domain protein n=1 Tax=Bacillus sp. ISL-7 TaxID=2819136 RepID=UPI001BE5E96C|nr:DnaD domain protein [Bacillus sp. ISL-7]MBT2738644.1 DnaD domain protein [Bacillus sp. ISL-7]
MTHRDTRRGQKEEENKKEKQQQEAFNPNKKENPDTENNQKVVNVKEIIEFWDNNGFGFSNMNAKQQLVSWLDDSSFFTAERGDFKAMNIACANNKRRLSYVVGILKNWVNDSLLTVEEIDSFYDSQNSAPNHRPSSESFPAGRAIPSGLNLTLRQVKLDANSWNGPCGQFLWSVLMH